MNNDELHQNTSQNTTINCSGDEELEDDLLQIRDVNFSGNGNQVYEDQIDTSDRNEIFLAGEGPSGEDTPRRSARVRRLVERFSQS